MPAPKRTSGTRRGSSSSSKSPGKPSSATFRISIVTYAPRAKGMPQHWAIWIASNEEPKSIILQLEDRKGEDGLFVAEPMKKDPFKSRKITKSIFVSHVLMDKRQEVIRLVQSNRVRRGDSGWNCQSWVMEGVEILRARGLIEVDQKTMDDLGVLRKDEPKGKEFDQEQDNGQGKKS